MSVLRFEPIANQISKLVGAADLLSPDVLDESRAAAERVREESHLPAHSLEYLWRYYALARAANDLLGAPHFARLLTLHEQIQEEYMPGGPPLSPIYDSFATQHVLGQVPHGPGSETPYSVMARLTAADGARAEFHELARALSESHLDLYRVLSADGLEAVLEPVRAGASFGVHLSAPFLETGDRMLARVIAFRGERYISESPYLLQASEREWLDYVGRVLEARQREEPAAPPAGARAKAKGKAKAKAKAKQRARRATPEQLIERHLQRGSSERYWLDYFMDAYAGERRGIVVLAGVPDRPEALPHSELYAELDDDDDDVPPPIVRLRMALARVAARERISAQAARELARAYEQLGLEYGEPTDQDEHLFMAYCMLGARSERGLTALEHFAREHRRERAGAAASFDPELDAVLAALERGWFSVARVERVHLDSGLELFDVLQGKTLNVSERAATRHVAVGDLLIGWLCQDEQGVLTLEGGIGHIHALLAPAVLEIVEAEWQAARRQGGDSSASVSRLVPVLLARLAELRENLPVPVLVNTSGEALSPATARYTIADRRAALDGLARAFQQDREGEGEGEESFAWLDESGTLLARIELGGDRLLVHVNSRERLERAKALVERTLGAAVKPSLDSFEQDLTQAVRARLKEPRAVEPPVELPPEVKSQFHAMVLQQIRANLDAPIPQFRNRTLREVARAERTRPDAINWLREQERILKSNPQMSDLDLRPLWHDLGLEYRGLDTDQPL